MESIARQLRISQTEVGKRLWYRIRNRQICGCKFRRQEAIGHYIVDFACFERFLIVELDGGQHATETAKDKRRTMWLESQGYFVLRFWNNDVIENMDGVLQRILQELDKRASVARPPHPGPLPQGEREV
jgi:very-short-patch-repair endonuclease